MTSSLDLVAWRAFLEAHARLTTVLERELRVHAGMPLAWYDVLVQLSESEDGRRRMQELARRVLFSRSGLSRLIDRMQAAGLVVREGDPRDGRGTYACVTSEGRAALRRAAPVHLRGIETHFLGLLEDHESQALTEAFQRMIESLDSSDEEG
jgi:DNA-binding MarR family transcriptional regulator